VLVAHKKVEEKTKEGVIYKQNLDQINAKKTSLKSEMTKVLVAQKKLQASKQHLEQENRELNYEQEMQKLRDEITNMNNQRCDKLLKLKTSLQEWAHVSFERDSNLLNLAALRDKLEVKKRECEAIIKTFEGLKTQIRKYQQYLQTAKDKLKERKAAAEREAPLERYKARFQEGWMPNDTEEIDIKIVEFSAQTEMNVADSDVMQRYTERQKELESMEAELSGDQTELEAADKDIKALEVKWKPKLLEIVEIVNKQFSNYYREINCEGEVKLNEADKDIEKYTLEIWLKYRGTGEKKLLTGQFQSGGERSVATMLFLLCLQKVSGCPFRVVDEINQGMDPKNERMIFDQIVKSSETVDTPQYFLVTPKLLPGLKYTPAVTVLFVFNGPWLCQRLSWEPKEFVEAMKKRKRKYS